MFAHGQLSMAASSVSRGRPGLHHHVGVSSPPARVLLLTHAIAPDRMGGLERYCRELARGLSRIGADVVLQARRVDPDSPEREIDEDGVEIVRFATPSKRDPTYALSYPLAAVRATRRILARERGQRLVHSHFPLPGSVLAFAGDPYLHTFHAPVYRELLSEHRNSYFLPAPARRGARRVTRALEARVVRRAEEVVVLSDFMGSEARTLGLTPDRLRLVPGGVDTERFAPGAPSRHPWAGHDGPLLFTARRLVPRTGVDELIDAFKTVAERFPAARLAIAGRGSLEAELRERVTALGLGDRVALLGWITDEDLVGWYRAADLVVMPTQELEGFGLTTAEALACGTPVVGTPVGATPEVLRRLDPSLVSRDRGADAIAAAIIELLTRTDRLAALAADARAAVHPELSWGHVVDQHLALYERFSAETSGFGPRRQRDRPRDED
jgi:glycosyltransferase involved in cell wall biosynthesis